MKENNQTNNSSVNNTNGSISTGQNNQANNSSVNSTNGNLNTGQNIQANNSIQNDVNSNINIKKNNSKSKNIVIIILSAIVVLMGLFMVYYFFIKEDKKTINDTPCDSIPTNDNNEVNNDNNTQDDNSVVNNNNEEDKKEYDFTDLNKNYDVYVYRKNCEKEEAKTSNNNYYYFNCDYSEEIVLDKNKKIFNLYEGYNGSALLFGTYSISDNTLTLRAFIHCDGSDDGCTATDYNKIYKMSDSKLNNPTYYYGSDEPKEWTYYVEDLVNVSNGEVVLSKVSFESVFFGSSYAYLARYDTSFCGLFAEYDCFN